MDNSTEIIATDPITKILVLPFLLLRLESSATYPRPAVGVLPVCLLYVRTEPTRHDDGLK